MTNVLLLVFYYGAIFPVGFFWASATLAIIYWVDKFCLLRVWAPLPALGTAIARQYRFTFVPLVLIAYALISSYNFASFPYDNACQVSSSVPPEYMGSFYGQTVDKQSVLVEVDPTLGTYRYCD